MWKISLDDDMSKLCSDLQIVRRFFFFFTAYQSSYIAICNPLTASSFRYEPRKEVIFILYKKELDSITHVTKR